MSKQETIELSEKNKFNFQGYAEILHLNTRKEGKEEDGKELAIDVKFRVKDDKSAFEFFELQDLAETLYTDIGAVANIYLDPISLSYELKHYRLKIAEKEYFGINLKKFVLEPLDGSLVAITFQATFHPSANEVALIAEHLQDVIKITIEPESLELELTKE